jgi:membrane protease YdiL (CAAX protease family)
VTVSRFPFPERLRLFPNRLRLVEPLAVFGLIMAYIWRFRVVHPWSWTFILTAVLLSHFLRHEGPTAIGYRTQGFTACLRLYGPALLLLVAIGFGSALEWGTLRPMTIQAAAIALGLYLPWGLFQQYLLNGYLLNRLEKVLSPAKSAIIAAALFSLAHLPNWFLMIATLAGGYCANLIYRRHKNLYFLGLAHAILGFTIFVAAPDWLIHHLRVGPGWFRQ